MSIRHRRQLLAAVFAALVVAAAPALLAQEAATPTESTDSDAPSMEDWRIESFRWEGSPGDARVLEVINEQGDVRTRFSGDGKVFVSAVIQRHKDDPYEAVIPTGTPEGEGEPMRIEVSWNSEDPQVAEKATAAMERRRVDITVFVPEEMKLVVRTEDGLIQAKGLKSDVEASTVSGEVRLSITGSASVRTDRGLVDVYLRSAEAVGPMRFESVTGDIAVWLPREAGVAVSAETFGELSTDVSVDVSYRENSDKKYVKAQLGDGKHPVEIVSNRGRVKILRALK